jgi:hypothetical protein
MIQPNPTVSSVEDIAMTFIPKAINMNAEVTVASVQDFVYNVYNTPVEGGRLIKISPRSVEQMNGLVDAMANLIGYDESKLTKDDLEAAAIIAYTVDKASLNGVIVNGELTALPEDEYDAMIKTIKNTGPFWVSPAQILVVMALAKAVNDNPEYWMPVEAAVEGDENVGRHTPAQEVFNRLIMNGGRYIDDHNGRNEVSIAQGWGIYKNGSKEYAFIGYVNSPFCINRCYIGDDNLVHVSTWSVGGNVRMDRFPGEPEKAIAAFNEAPAFRGERQDSIIAWITNRK